MLSYEFFAKFLRTMNNICIINIIILRSKGSIFLLGQLDVVNLLKDTYREKAPPNKTRLLTRGTNVNIWGAGTSNQLFIKDSETKFQNSKLVTVQDSVLCGRSTLYRLFYLSSHWFWQASFAWKWCIFNLSTINYKIVLQFFGKGSRFLKNLFQS